MSEIKKINGIALCDETARQDLQACVKTVNGVTPDADGNVKVNSLLIVTINEDGNVSHTPAEIYAHVQAGGRAVWYFAKYQTNVALETCDELNAYFTFISIEESLFYQLAIYGEDGEGGYDLYRRVLADNDKITAPSTAKVGQTVVVAEVDEDGKPTKWKAADLRSGGSDIFTVKFTYDGLYGPNSGMHGGDVYDPDKTTAEILAAIQAGTPVLAVYTDERTGATHQAFGAYALQNPDDGSPGYYISVGDLEYTDDDYGRWELTTTQNA